MKCAEVQEMKDFIEVVDHNNTRFLLNLRSISFISLAPDSRNVYEIRAGGVVIFFSREELNRILAAIKQL